MTAEHPKLQAYRATMMAYRGALVAQYGEYRATRFIFDKKFHGPDVRIAEAVMIQARDEWERVRRHVR